MLEVEDRVLLAGDWHGSFAQADNVIRFAKELGIKVIVQLGDFGIWHNDKPFLNRMQALLGQWGITLYFIDGNHEDFPRLYDKKVLADGTRFVRDNIFYLPRGHRWEWGGLRFLALGGAASIDRKHRRNRYSWWEEEAITDEDVERSIQGGKVDILFSHDSPILAPNSITDDPVGQAMAVRFWGEDVLDYCTNHRVQLGRVTDAVTPRLIFHGHYHLLMSGYFEHPDGTQAAVRGLDQGIANKARHTFILDFAGVKEEISKLDSIQRK